MDELEIELKRERENGDRLAAALRVLVSFQRPEDSILHCLLMPTSAQLTVGYVVEGALALHDATTKQRSES